MVAIINAHYDFAEMLLDHGADPNVADMTGTAALYFLVDMHTLGGMQGRPAPKLVDTIDAEGLLKKMIAKGANPNARLQRPMLGRYHGSGDATLGEGTTPFLRAAKAVDVPFMRALLAGGADATLTKKDRTNAVMLVAAGQRTPATSAPLRMPPWPPLSKRCGCASIAAWTSTPSTPLVRPRCTLRRARPRRRRKVSRRTGCEAG